MARRLLPALAACAVLLPACTATEGSGDELQVVDDPVAASPANSPEQLAEPAGTVIELDQPVTDVLVDERTGGVAVAAAGDDDAGDDDTGDAVLFYSLDEPEEDPEVVTVPGEVEQLSPAAEEGAVVASLPEDDAVLHVSANGGVAARTPVDGGPASTAEDGGQRLVAARDRAAVDVFEHEQRITSISGSISSADRVLVAGGNAVVLDRIRSALFEVHTDEREIGLGQRAGQGATNAAADGFGRVLVTDSRSDGLLAFALDPLMLVQRHPVPGGVYGLAVDEQRDRAWVTLTERNEVVGFDLAGGEPQEIARMDTVRQPDSVSVGANDGHVVIGSALGEGIQVIEP